MGKQTSEQAARKAARERGYREREERWRGHLAAWRKGGTTQVAYCRGHGLTRADFSWWKSELARRDGVAKRNSTGGAPGASFVPVHVITCETEKMIGEVVLRNGRRLRIGTECKPEWVAKMATALEATRPC